MKRMLLAVALALPALALAATLENVAGALALPANASHSANDWDSTNAIAGVRWQHKGLKETPVSPFTRMGNIKLDGLSVATVFFTGVRTMVFELTVIVGGNGASVIENEDFGKALRAQFGSRTEIKRLRGGCKNEGVVSGSSVYQVTMPAKKPLYVFMDTDAGGNAAEETRTTTIQFLLEPENSWKCKT